MLRRFFLFVSFLSLAVIAAITISCGSSKPANNSTTCRTVYNVVGNWQLTVTDTGGSSLTMYGAIDSAGLALFFDNSAPLNTGDTAELPTISGNCSFSGNISAYPEPGGPNSGPGTATDAAEGTVNSSSSLNGSFSGAASGTFSAATFTPLTGSVTAVTGGKTGSIQGLINNQLLALLPLTFIQTGSGDSMSFSTNQILNPNCTESGTFTQVGTNNVFDVSTTFTGASCPIAGTFTGIGFESSTDYFGLNGGVPDTYLYANVLASSNTFVMEVY
jgi:hypothetical protein